MPLALPLLLSSQHKPTIMRSLFLSLLKNHRLIDIASDSVWMLFLTSNQIKLYKLCCTGSNKLWQQMIPEKKYLFSSC